MAPRHELLIQAGDHDARVVPLLVRLVRTLFAFSLTAQLDQTGTLD
ncbi:MAG: hypothetical protein ACRELG_11575 [Gemmataceae bacterium]